MYTDIEVRERRIGEIKIIDLAGSLTGFWAKKLTSMLELLVEPSGVRMLGINLLDVQSIDTLGVRAISSLLPRVQRIGIICPTVSVTSILRDSQWGHLLEYFPTEASLVEAFSTPSGRERRRYRRYKLTLPASLTIRGGNLKGPLRGRVTVKNISGGGMLVDGLKGLNAGNHFSGNERLSFELPIGENDKNLTVEADAVRISSSGRDYRLAVQFVNLSDELRHLIITRISKCESTS